MKPARTRPVTYRPPRPTAWLWVLALVFIGIAAGMIALMRAQLPDPAVESRIRIVYAIAAIGSGLCVISAIAWRWFRR